MKLEPEILCHHRIPESLHYINPRTIEGRQWWDKTRLEVYASTDYHCLACGVHKKKAKIKKWLEAHEFWNINYETGECTITKIVPLCHCCHNFIHTGRLEALLQKQTISRTYVKTVLEHGFEILAKNNLQCFPLTLKLAESIKANTFGVTSFEIKTELNKKDFYLNWQGKIYKKEEEVLI